MYSEAPGYRKGPESSWKAESLTGSIPDIPVETIVDEPAKNETLWTPSSNDSRVTEPEEPQPSDGSNNEPNMTDEEFEAFMKKAQAFYDTQASENSDNSDDDDDFPSIEVHTND